MEQLGTTIGSQAQRIIFRNGHQSEMTPVFFEKVMQHCEQVDKKSYVKARLMHGPWSH